MQEERVNRENHSESSCGEMGFCVVQSVRVSVLVFVVCGLCVWRVACCLSVVRHIFVFVSFLLSDVCFGRLFCDDITQESPTQGYITEFLFHSLVTYIFPRQLHSPYTTSLLIFCDMYTCVVMNRGVSSSEPRSLVSASLSTAVKVSVCALHSCLQHS